MPGFNGAGVFERTYDWTDDKAAAIKVRADRMDAEFDAIATGLSNVICRDGQSTITANIPFNNKKITGLAAGTTAGDAVRYEQVVLLSAGAAQTITRSSNGTTLTLESTADPTSSAFGPQLVLHSNSGTGATDGDLGGAILFDMDDSGGTQTTFARIGLTADDITDATEDATLKFAVVTAGTLANELSLTGAALSPTSSDGLSLGTSSLMFSDLFLASGGVVNWNNGDVTVTHSSNALAFAGASSGYTFDSSITATGALLPTVSNTPALGSASAMWADLFLGSGAVINFDNGDVTVTHSSNALAFSGASGGYTFDAALSIGTSAVFTAGTIELGHASDTTIARSAAGTITVEGNTLCRIKTGTYTGDGATSKSVTGVGFTPKYVKVWRRNTSDAGVGRSWETTTDIIDDHASGAALALIDNATYANYNIAANTIIALGSDGFTVDDAGTDADPNANGIVYNYLCLG